jgi:hypothetical protein
MANPLVGVDPRWLLYAAAIAAVGYVAWKVTKAAGAGVTVATEAARSVVAAVNPADDRNLANRAVSAAGAAITGDDSWSLGGQLAEWFDPATRAANDSLRTPTGSRADFRRSELSAPVWNAPGGTPDYINDPASTYSLGASA